MITETVELKSQCIKKWCRDEDVLDDRLTQFVERFDNWHQQISPEHRSTVYTLVEHIEYYSHKYTNSCLKELHNKLLEDHDISDDNTIYVFIKSKDGQSNSSNDYWTEYKAINKINKHICIENMDVFDQDDWEHIINIVFIEDFSGSGKSFIDELNKTPARYCGKNVFFITINTMFAAKEAINKYCSEKQINIVLISAEQQRKAFEQDLFLDNKKAELEICEMSRSFEIPEKYILGFNQSQALAVFYNNTPNNTFGFIWFDNSKCFSLFPRDDDPLPIWQRMKKNRKKRNRANYNNKVRGQK